MKAIIELDVPEFQIGQEVSIYFKDTMMIKGIVQEQKAGHWIEKDGFDGDVYYDCSKCGESWATIEGTPWDNEWDYCPSCGARMVEDTESEDKCKNCKYYSNPDYERCHKCKAGSEDKE